MPTTIDTALPPSPSKAKAKVNAMRGRLGSYAGILVVGIIAYFAVTQLRGDQGLVAVLVVAWAIALIGLNVIQGLAGYPSIAQAAFFGIGAYSSSILFNAGWPFFAAAATAVAITTAVGGVVALVFGRTRGQYFAIGTLFFSAVCTLVASNEVDISGGPNGLSVRLGMPLPVLLVVMVISLVVGLLVFDTLSRSRLGDRLRAIRSDEDLAEHLGVPTATTKAFAVVISAFFGGWAGVLIAQYNGVVAPSQFTFFTGFLMFVAVGIGGYGRLFTPIVGAVVVIVFSQLLEIQPGVSQIVLGVIFILITLLMPGGILGSLPDIAQRLRRRGRNALS